MIHSVKKILFCSGLLLLAACAPQVAEKPVDLVWPNPPETPRIRYIRSLSRTTEFGSSTSSLIQSLFGDQTGGTMAKPYGTATDSEGKVYVTDTGLNMVWVFDERNKKVNFLGTSGQGALKTPIGIAVDARDTVFVSDVALQRVYGFDRKGELAVAIGDKDELPRPSGLAIDRSSNRLFVADSKLHKIRVYDSVSGKFVKEIGRRGIEEGEFNIPTNLFIRNGRLYVTDTGNFRIQVLDLDGNFLTKIGKIGDAPGMVARPKGVAVDSENHVYVVDAAFDNFQIFSDQGEILLFVGEAGRTPGRFWLPAGIHIDDEDRVYVADSYNRRVQVFQYLGEKHRAKLAAPATKP